MAIEDALAQPRFHHQWKPDELRIEKTVPEKTRGELSRRGHTLKVVESIGAAQAVSSKRGGRKLAGAPDPRGEGLAAGN
jgi:gamma-glutamyltranspeptidase/glutathione hydrolase